MSVILELNQPDTVRLTSMVLFPVKESPHLLLEILLKAFERQGLKCILLAAWAPPLSIFTQRYKELKAQCDGMRSSGHRSKAGWRKPCVDGGEL